MITFDLHNSNVSSDLSLQSEIPSQMENKSMHSPDLQLYSSVALNSKHTIFLHIHSYILV